jgi:hypothetical protein
MMRNNNGAVTHFLIGLTLAFFSALIIRDFAQTQAKKPKDAWRVMAYPASDLTNQNVPVYESEIRKTLSNANTSKKRNNSPSEIEHKQRKKLVGSWQNDDVRLNYHYLTIWSIRPDGNSTHIFFTPKGTNAQNGKWKYENGYTYEEFAGGGYRTGRVNWKNDNAFELTILDNDNGLPVSSALKKLFVRR